MRYDTFATVTAPIADTNWDESYGNEDLFPEEFVFWERRERRRQQSIIFFLYILASSRSHGCIIH